MLTVLDSWIRLWNGIRNWNKKFEKALSSHASFSAVILSHENYHHLEEINPIWIKRKLCSFVLRNNRLFYLFRDKGPYHIETSPLICRANQWTGFYMIGTSVMKELKVLVYGLISSPFFATTDYCFYFFLLNSPDPIGIIHFHEKFLHLLV